jgi:tripartite-type tricarboxylate transporter receptor subunit TctC
MRLRAICAICAVYAVWAVAVLAASPAFAADPYYKGKRLTLLIGAAVGGPTDIEGRLLAKHLSKHIDGQPAIVVQNREGAGGVVGATFLGEVAPRDGTMLGYFSGTAWNFVSEPERWRVDLRAFEFIAYQSGTTIHFMRTDVPPGMKEPADIAKAQGLIAGGIVADNPKDVRLRLALDMLGVPHRYVTGYLGSMQARLALQRNEIHIFSESPSVYRTAIEPTLVKSGEVMPVWYDLSGDADSDRAAALLEGLNIPSFPALHQAITGVAPSGPKWEAFRTIHNVNSTLQRLIALPPGAPAEAAAALREAIARLNQDQEFAAESVRTIGFAADYETGPDIAARVRALLVASPEVRAFVADYIKSAHKK